jgi:methylthioxylose transferase
MNGRRTAIGFTLVAAGSLAVLWCSSLPLGVPGEWVWDRIPVAGGEWLAVAFGWLEAGLVGAIYIALVLVGARRLEGASRATVCGWLAALTVGGFAWLWAVQDSPADPAYRLAKTGWVLYFRGTEGYFDQARYEMRDVSSYLKGYERLMAQGDVLHLGTHPPGLMLFHRACLKLCTGLPALRELLLRTQPTSFREALDQTEELNRGSPRALLPSDRAALWLAALVTQALAAGALVPIYLLVRRDDSRPVAWLTAAIWPLVPALAVFLPKSDALLPFLGAIFLWLWLEGFRTGRLLLCFLAGLIFWLCMFVSLAILPIGAAALLLTLWEAGACSRDDRTVLRPRDWVLRPGAAAIGWAIPVVALFALAGINLLRVWAWNYHNHAGFYQQNVRTYWLWLVANPIEFVFALGAPLALAAILGICFRLWTGWRRRAAGPTWCLTAVWLLLWLSGKNMGEAARLWLILMPWAVWLSAGYFAAALDSLEESADRRRAIWATLALLALQMIVCLGTVTRVTGFRWT